MNLKAYILPPLKFIFSQAMFSQAIVAYQMLIVTNVPVNYVDSRTCKLCIVKNKLKTEVRIILSKFCISIGSSFSWELNGPKRN